MTGRQPERTPDPSMTLVRMEIPKELPPPQGVNFFQLSHTGPEVQLLVGYTDIQKMAELLQQKNVKRERDGAVLIRPEVTHRLFLSLRGLAFLKAQIDDLVQKMQSKGIPIETIAPVHEGGDGD